jgi:multidrug transporter EmrE-like cation transporter
MNYLLILFSTIVAILPVIFIKKYVLTKNYSYILMSLILYVLLAVSYINIFKEGIELSIVYTLLQILQILVIFFVGIFYFNENINQNKIIGTILGISSVYFLLKK